MSFTSEMSRAQLRSAMATISRASSDRSPSTPPESRLSEPRMEASGVRSSWLTVETNSCLSFSTACRSDTSRTLPAKCRPGVEAVNSNMDSSKGNSSPPLRWPRHSVMRPMARAKASLR